MQINDGRGHSPKVSRRALSWQRPCFNRGVGLGVQTEAALDADRFRPSAGHAGTVLSPFASERRRTGSVLKRARRARTGSGTLLIALCRDVSQLKLQAVTLPKKERTV
jgi:hypothetical protein